MAALTNTGAEVVERQVVQNASPRPPSLALEDMYEINRCVAWVRKGGYQKVCLQFPDELLGDAAAVAQALMGQLGQVVYILGDTTYGSCCVDEVAAEHVGSDAVIHFGNTCLSPSQRLPVLYIPTRLPVDVSRVAGQLKEALMERKDAGHPLVLLYDTRCHYAADELFSELQSSFPSLVLSTLEGLWHHEQKSADCCNVLEDCMGNSTCACNESESCETSKCNDPRETNGPSDSLKSSESGQREVKFNGRRVSIPDGADIKDSSFIYVGPRGPTLDCLLLRFPENTFHHVPPSDGAVETLSGMQSLIRRSIKLEMIRDAEIIGILVGTLGVARYREAITRLKTIIKTAGKRSYTFVVGKPNEPKLANISEVDVFVYVACPETTIVDRGSDPVVYRKLVAPWEVEVALVAGREWSMTFEPDFSALLPGGAHHVEVSEVPREEEASVSLITNRTQALGVRNSPIEEGTAGPVVVQEGKVLATIHVGGGGQVLGGRSWAGLDPSLPPPALGTAVVEGRKGIAAEYQDETL